jgi:hypothetical protein
MTVTVYAKGLTVEVFDKPPVDPPIDPPVETGIKYRNQQRYLFQTVRAASEPARIPGAPPYANESTGSLTVGPTPKFVDRLVGWPWDRTSGDFLDKNLARNPATPVPWFSVRTDAVAGNTLAHTYTTDATDLVGFVQKQGRWNALLLDHGASTYRPIASTFTATPPSMNVTYTDSTTEVLKCRIVAAASVGSDYSNTTSAAIQLPAFMEFERPSKPVQSATITFTVTQHWAGPHPEVSGYVLDPPMNSDPVVMGIAATSPLDAGLSANPSIIGVHRYLDGTAFNDFAMPPVPTGIFPMSGGSYNTGSEDWFDPAIYGNGPQDLRKLPHHGLGKWLNTNVPTPPEQPGQRSKWELVKSDYVSTDGFKPLAPGVGAMRIFMEGNHALVDGATEFSALGHATTGAVIFLPEPLWGIDDLFVRYYVRLGAPRGSPYRVPMKDRLQVLIGGTPKWTDCTGKFGIMPTHDNSYGGFSGSAGGGAGWQMRLSWADITTDDIGPDLGGTSIGLHTFDFQFKNPPGYNFGQTDTPKESGFGQRGGLGGMLYAENWYCYESQIKLNTVMDTAPGFVADGEIRQWIDGRLVLERTGMVFRTLPLYNPGFISGKQRPIRKLGHRNLLLNWFHGGTTQNTIDRSCYISQLAWGTKYIGPMKGAT